MTTLATLYRAGLMSPADKALLATIPYPLSGMIYQSDTPPASPTATPFWFNTTDGQMYIYYGSAWVTTANFSGGNGYVPTTGGVVTGNLSVQGTTTIVSGTIDGTVIGGTNPAAASVTSMNGGQLAGFRNRIHNGNALINQRVNGAAVNQGLAYFVDRWIGESNFSVTTSAVTSFNQASSGGNYGSNNQYLMSANGGSGTAVAAGTNYVSFRQRIEAISIADLAGQTVTLSFYAATNTTGSASQLFGTVFIGAPTSGDNFGSTNYITPLTFYPTPGSQKFTTTFTMPSACTNGCEVIIRMNFNNGGTTVIFNVTSVQLEAGSIATPYEQIPLPLQMAQCQRFYGKTYAYTTAPGTTLGASSGSLYGATGTAGTQIAFTYPFKTTMRIAPTFVAYDNAGTSGAISYYTTGWNNGGTVPNRFYNHNSVAFQGTISNAQLFNFDATFSADL